MKDGDVKTYFYGLFDDGSGKFGLMNADGTPKPAGTAIHNLTTLLADTGATAATFTAGSLAYTLSGTTASDNTLLMQKSDGSYWLSLWNENDAAHNVTITLPAAARFQVFDPLTGTAVVSTTSGSTATVRLPDHPILVEIQPTTTAPPPPPPPPHAPPPPPPPPTPDDLSLASPNSETLPAGTTLTIAGVLISDPWAATAPGSMIVNLWDTGGGSIAMDGQTATSAGGITVRARWPS